MEKTDNENDVYDIPDPKFVLRDPTDNGVRVDYFRPRDPVNVTINTSRIVKAILIAAVIIAAAQLYSSRYMMSGLGTTNGSIVVDTWFWRTSVCHEGGCNEWRE